MNLNEFNETNANFEAITIDVGPKIDANYLVKEEDSTTVSYAVTPPPANSVGVTHLHGVPTKPSCEQSHNTYTIIHKFHPINLLKPVKDKISNAISIVTHPNFPLNPIHIIKKIKEKGQNILNSYQQILSAISQKHPHFYRRGVGVGGDV